MTSIPVAERRDNLGSEIDSRAFGLDLWVGTGFAALLAIGFVVWFAFTPVSSVVIAPAFVLTGSHMNYVQHPEGGIVTEIKVQEGDEVEVGDILIRLDDTEARRSYESIQSALDKARAHLARLAAESEGKPDLRLPPELSARAHLGGTATVIAAEQALLDVRMQTLWREGAMLRQLIAQLEAESGSYSFQSSSQEYKKHGAVTLGDYASFAALFPVAPLKPAPSSIGSLAWGHIGGVRERIAEIELEIMRIDEGFRTEALQDMADAEARVASLEEKLVEADRSMRGLEVRAPSSGLVYDLQILDLDVVVRPGERILTIIPRMGGPVIEARVRPQDIDEVVVGQKASVRFPGFARKAAAEVEGRIETVAVKVTVDSQSKRDLESASYYSVRIGLPHDRLSQLDGARLKAGMPAEVLIRTASRYAPYYVVKPFFVR